ncbi:Uma2 family endonuclease [Myxococcota bacterium]|nr:Uma2 family endonuclease [Myxococcota bacterium]
MLAPSSSLSEVSGGVVYPSSDGQPMADNTLQLEWIVTLKENLDVMLPDAFVAGDLLWYPVEGDNRTRRAPDVLVALGRPKGHRSSYRQWEEGGVAPQVVVEVWSPSNTFAELVGKAWFYGDYGVQELWVLDPDHHTLSVFTREGGRLVGHPVAESWTSPLLGVRFEVEEQAIRVFGPDGQPFLRFAELRARAEEERARAEGERARADREAARAEALAARLRALGVDPD